MTINGAGRGATSAPERWQDWPASDSAHTPDNAVTRETGSGSLPLPDGFERDGFSGRVCSAHAEANKTDGIPWGSVSLWLSSFDEELHAALSPREARHLASVLTRAADEAEGK